MGKSKDLATGAAYQDQTESDTRYVNTAGDSMTGELLVRRARSNTAGDAALTIHPSDTTVSYGMRIDQNTNSLNFDQVNNNTTKMSINSSGYVTNPYQPAFNAYRNSSLAISGLTSLVFNTVRSNASSSYNNSTGVFTAPVDGQYLFNHKGLYYNMSTSEFCDLYAYVNGSERTRYEQTGNGGGHVQVDYSEIVYLSANDTFRLYANNRSSGNGFNMYNNENHFSGRLLG